MTSFILAYDWVPRMTVQTMNKFREEVLDSIGGCLKYIFVYHAHLYICIYMNFHPQCINIDIYWFTPTSLPHAARAKVHKLTIIQSLFKNVEEDDVLYRPGEEPDSDFKRCVDVYKVIICSIYDYSNVCIFCNHKLIHE